MDFKLPEILLTALNRLMRKIGLKPKGKNLVVELSDLSKSIEASLVDVEDDFLELGQKFQSIVSKTGELKSLVVKTSEYSGSKNDGSGVAGVGEFARSSLQTLTDYQSNILKNLDILGTGSDHLQSLSKMCDSIDKVASLLRVVAINIAVESNRSAESREMFMVFVKEVREISEQITHVSQELSHDSGEILKKQTKFNQEISDQLNQLQNLTGEAEKVVNQSVEAVENIMENSMASLERAIGCSDDINHMVSSIVMAMQFHDIVRQQIEHIVMAIDDAVQLYEASGETLIDSASIQKIMGEISSTIMIQNAQLKSTIGEIDSVYMNIMSSFEGIESKVAELLSCMSYSGAESASGDSGGDLFSIVLSGFENLNKLLDDAQQLNLSMNGAAGEASTATGRLIRHVDNVQRISLDLHRKALNAIIKAAHLGDMGRALEVFANEVTTASNESTVFADKVVEHIELISSLTSQISETLEKENSEESMALSVVTSIDSISNSYDDFLANSNITLKMSNELEQSISDTKLSLSFISGFSNDLKNLLDESEGILNKIKDEFKAEITDITEVSDRYTMESERLVHLSLLNADAEKEFDVEETETEEGSFELFDDPPTETEEDGFELFDDSPTETEDGIELFDDFSAEADDSDIPESSDQHELQEPLPKDLNTDSEKIFAENKDESEDEFDDNIELF